MVPPVNVLAVATAVPPHELEQRAVADAARKVYARTFARFPKLVDVFVNAGIGVAIRRVRWLRSCMIGPSGPRPISKAQATCSCGLPVRLSIALAFLRAMST